MNALLMLWLPILLSAVVVFVISSLVHMVFKWHASDYTPFPNEDAVRAAIRSGNPTPGRYILPHCRDMKDMASDAMRQKYIEGPIGHVTIMPNGIPNMGKYLGIWFVFCLLVSVVVALLASRLIPIEATFSGRVAKLAFTVSFIAYGFGTIQESIWSGRPWSSSAKYLLDALLYAAGTAAVFFWFWR